MQRKTPVQPQPSRIEWMCRDCAFDVDQMGYDVTRAVKPNGGSHLIMASGSVKAR